MTAYIIRRLLEGLAVLFFVSVVLFFITYSIGDPVSTLTDGSRPPTGEEADRLRRILGLDRPLPLQYVFWLIGNDWALVDADADGDYDENIYGRRQGILRGDFGLSLLSKEPVLPEILSRFPNTFVLVIPSYLLVLTIALLVGVYTALRPRSFIGNLLTSIALAGYSFPIYLVCIGSIYLFAVQFQKWGLPSTPVAGMWDLSQPRNFANLFQHMILPVASLTLVQSAAYIRYIRASVLDVLNEGYVTTARSKGLRERGVIGRHVLRPASLTLVTLIGLDLPLLLGGAVVTESIFAWPGVGLLFLNSLERFDYPMLMGLLILISTMVIVFQILTDLLYAVLDPRISLTGKASV